MTMILHHYGNDRLNHENGHESDYVHQYLHDCGHGHENARVHDDYDYVDVRAQQHASSSKLIVQQII